MPLTIQEIREILKEPKSGAALRRAKAHEARVQLHTEVTLSADYSREAATVFLNWVRGLLTPDKFKTFCHLFTYPIKTVSLTSEIFGALEKVFDGVNPVFDYDFLSPEAAEDWEWYQNEVLHEREKWRTDGFDAFRCAPNSIVVVDLPAQQTTPLPQPYFYFLSIADVLEIDLKNNTFEWVIFKQGPEQIAVFDTEAYQVFRTGENDHRDIIEQLAYVPHDLGYCPAKWFWSRPLSKSETFVKRSVLSEQLSNLDWLLYYMLSKRHLDTHAGFPLYWSFEIDCDYENTESGQYCDGGFLKGNDGNYLFSRTMGTGYNQVLTECPACSAKRFKGAGTVLSVPPPGPANDGANMREPAGIITVDRNALDYNVEEEKRLSLEIYQSVTGDGGEPINDQAVNEKQVRSIYEAQTATLRKIKKGFEAIQKWTDETMCLLRYGAQRFVSVSINYGTDFYLETAETILEEYHTAKKEKADSLILDGIQDQYLDTKYRNNPELLFRTRIILNVDPFRHLSNAEVSAMQSLGLITYQDYYLKVNLSSLIMRFERENISITEFGAALDFDKRIDAIRETLLSYIVQPELPAPEPEPQNL